MGIFGRHDEPGRTREQMLQAAEDELADWHLRHPLYTFRVYYTGGNGNEKVKAHRYILEQVGDFAVFMFEVVTPRVTNLVSLDIDTSGLAVLTVPYEQVQSINVETGEGDGTTAAR